MVVYVSPLRRVGGGEGDHKDDGVDETEGDQAGDTVGDKADETEGDQAGDTERDQAGDTERDSNSGLLPCAMANKAARRRATIKADCMMKKL